jgi:hypothetical protein
LVHKKNHHGHLGLQISLSMTRKKATSPCFRKKSQWN